MRTLILYGSKHGCTAKCAYLLRDKLENADVIDLSQNSSVSLSLDDYDAVLIGTSVYVGKINKAVAKFCTANLDKLKAKRIGLFVCCGLPEKAMEQLETGFPKELVQAARVKAYFGYQYEMDQLNFFERIIMRLVGKHRNETAIRHAAIEDFARSFVQENWR
ncbi:MAG: flavodoxin [Firmicutes bacterium]|nr:flavodoxin [Bacillota bacterium]